MLSIPPGQSRRTGRALHRSARGLEGLDLGARPRLTARRPRGSVSQSPRRVAQDHDPARRGSFGAALWGVLVHVTEAAEHRGNGATDLLQSEGRDRAHGDSLKVLRGIVRGSLGRENPGGPPRRDVEEGSPSMNRWQTHSSRSGASDTAPSAIGLHGNGSCRLSSGIESERPGPVDSPRQLEERDQDRQLLCGREVLPRRAACAAKPPTGWSRGSSETRRSMRSRWARSDFISRERASPVGVGLPSQLLLAGLGQYRLGRHAASRSPLRTVGGRRRCCRPFLDGSGAPLAAGLVTKLPPRTWMAGHAVNGVVAEHDLSPAMSCLPADWFSVAFLGAVRREMAWSSSPA